MLRFTSCANLFFFLSKKDPVAVRLEISSKLTFCQKSCVWYFDLALFYIFALYKLVCLLLIKKCKIRFYPAGAGAGLLVIRLITTIDRFKPTLCRSKSVSRSFGWVRLGRRHLAHRPSEVR